MKHEPYTCVRCGYKTNHKASMKRHLFSLKKTCPKTINDIDFTDEVRNTIMENRIYHLPNKVDQTKVLNQTINNFNIMNNFINGMDILDKLQHWTNYSKVELSDFGNKVEDSYQKNVKRLTDSNYKYCFELKTTDLLEIIDQVSRLSDQQSLEDFNILYDEKINKLALYESGVWESLLIESGLKKLVIIIQSSYLDAYEQYLIRKIMDRKTLHTYKMDLRELLYEYYKFIGCFDIDPYVKEKNNNQILYNEDHEKFRQPIPSNDINSHTIQDEYLPYYNSIRDKTTKSEITRSKKDVLEIIKRNTKKNIDELNKKLVSLINMDEEFKNHMFYCLNSVQSCAPVSKTLSDHLAMS